MFIGRWSKEKEIPVAEQCVRLGNVLHASSCRTYIREDLRVCFEGTIYNKKELAYDDIRNDAEVIARLFGDKGYMGFRVLDGSFTFIVQTAELSLIVRDHHGTASQVYYTDSYYASSLSMLQRTAHFQRTPNYQGLSSFLSVGYIPTSSSAFSGVHKLGAGELLLYKEGITERVNLYPTNTITPVSFSQSLDDLSVEYGNLHAEAIKRRIKDCNRVGILLSGGYDSGSNLAALRKIYQGDVRSYSVGFKGDNWTELPLARCMSEAFHTHHTEYEIDGSEVTALPQIVAHLGDPFVEGGLMVNYAAMQMIGDDKPDVILGGDGSDQYFGTSGREVALHYLLSKSGMKPLVRLIYQMLNKDDFDTDTIFFRIRFHLDKILNILQGDLFGFPGFRLKEMVQDASFLPVPDQLRSDIRSFDHLYLQHAYKSDLEKIINQVILFKASRMAELFTNKIAFPFTDLSLYNFLQQLPVHYKCKGDSAFAIARGHSAAKYLLKYHYKPLLPELITNRKKQGGFAPMPLFFNEDKQRARMADFILESSITKDFLKRDAVESFVCEYDREVHEPGRWFWYRQSKAIRYFNLLTLTVWWEQFMNGNDSTDFLK